MPPNETSEVTPKRIKATKVKGSGKARGTGPKNQLADHILDLTPGMPPMEQGLLHRFSLRLQASVAMAAVKWISMYAMLVTICAVILAIYTSTNVRVVAVDAYGRLWEISTSKEAMYSNSKITSFASDVVIELFDMTFANFERRLEKITNRDFTDFGKTQLQTSIQPLIAELRDSQGTLTVQQYQGLPAKIIQSNQEKTEWFVEVPVVMTLAPQKGDPVTNIRKITLNIHAINNMDKLQGLAVQQTVMGTL